MNVDDVELDPSLFQIPTSDGDIPVSNILNRYFIVHNVCVLIESFLQYRWSDTHELWNFEQAGQV